MTAILDADTAEDKLAVVHAEGEPALIDVNCRLYLTALQLERLGMINGDLPPAPYGCDIDDRSDD